jgi:hypothetical protein
MFGDRSPRKDFEDFDAANPLVWELFKKFTFQAIGVGRSTFSARVILGRIRWETAIETNSGDGLKINDHHSPYYSRKFMSSYPQHAGFFRTRRVDGW